MNWIVSLAGFAANGGLKACHSRMTTAMTDATASFPKPPIKSRPQIPHKGTWFYFLDASEVITILE